MSQPRTITRRPDVRLTLFTVRVLQAETGFMTFCHSGAVCVEQIVVGEDVHAVIVAVKQKHCQHVLTATRRGQR